MQPKTILVTGKNGQLGQSLQKIATNYPQYGFTFVGREELDLSQPQSIDSYFEDKDFDIIINCAAYTAVDKAESEPELADQINHLAVKQIAKIAKDKNMALIHISTDYVFNGKTYKPYTESDKTDPQSVYGRTKLKGEQAIQKFNPKGCIIRTSWVYSEFGNNFVKTMLRLGRERGSLNVICDQVGAPVYAEDLAKVILEISLSTHGSDALSTQKFENKIFHYSNEGVCSWYDFAKTIFKASGIECDIYPIETREYPTPAKRPHYSLLNKKRVKDIFGTTIPYWADSLEICLNNMDTYRK